MQVIVERGLQALGISTRGFEPITLEHHRRSLDGLEVGMLNTAAQQHFQRCSTMSNSSVRLADNIPSFKLAYLILLENWIVYASFCGRLQDFGHQLRRLRGAVRDFDHECSGASADKIIAVY